MRHSARAIIIKDRKILLLTGHGADFYWTPGGGLEATETPIEALSREIGEELGVGIASARVYLAYDYGDQRVSSFMVELAGPPAIGGEISGLIWYQPGDSVKLAAGFQAVLLPRLLADGRL